MLGSAATFGYVLDHRRSKSGKNWLRVGVQVFHVDRNGDTDGGEVACGRRDVRKSETAACYHA